MAAIPPMDLAAAKAVLRDDFHRKMDDDLKYEKCIWCTKGSGKSKNGKPHSLLNCPNARLAPTLRTALSNEVFNAGQEDVAVAYIHQLQLKQYPREDGETTFSTGRFRYLMDTFTASTAPEPVTKKAEKAGSTLDTPVAGMVAGGTKVNPTLRTDQAGSTISASSTATETDITTKRATGIAPHQTPVSVPTRPSAATLPVAVASPSPVSPAQFPIATATNIIYEDENVPMAPQQNPPTTRDLQKSANIIRARGDTVQKLRALQNLNMDFPAREGFSKATSMVYTNHFQIKLRPDQQLYRYNIQTSMTGKNKRKMKALVNTAIRTYGFLSNNTANFATDYFETIIAWKPLHPLVEDQYKLVNGNGQDIGSSWQLPQLQDDGLALRLNITFDSMVDIDSFLKYTDIDPGHATTDLEPTERALNILISKCFGEATTNMIQTGANKFFCKCGSAPLTGNNNLISRSLCTLRGYYYTIKAGIREVLLNINTGTSAFYQPILVSELMLDRVSFYEWEVEQALKGVRVHIEYERGDKKKDAATWDRLNSARARVKTIQGLGLPVSEQEFKDENDKKHTVKDHLERTYHKTLFHPNLPAVNLGSVDDPKWYAPEDLKIVPYQIFKSACPPSLAESMLTNANHQPWDAAALVEIEALHALGINNSHQLPMALPNCPVLTIDPRLMQVPSHRFGRPTIQYGNTTYGPGERNNSWNTIGKDFYQKNAQTYDTCVLYGAGFRNDHMETGMDSFQDYAGPPAGRFTNYSVARINYVDTRSVSDPKRLENLRTAIDQSTKKNKNIKFLLLLLTRKDATAYARFKDLADRTYGYHSICMTERICQGKIGQKMGNIMMKANLKTAGSNHTIANGVLRDIMKDTLVLGADVTHPNSSSIVGCPSIAAIVGSVDDHAGRFLGSMRLQSEGKKEMIDHVKAMVVERIIDWIKQTSKRFNSLCLPKNIIYYRDGVSEAQYLSVRDEELPLIKEAWPIALQELKDSGNTNYASVSAYKDKIPKLTAIVCAKRHHVRFYPATSTRDDMDQNNGNCYSGTHVDDVVTSGYYADFYLQSHAPLKATGTARPAHYFVVLNKMNKSVDTLRQLTHQLCFTYVRSTCAVSYASPAYYADRLCERGRHYLRDFFVNTPEGQARRDKLKQVKRSEEIGRAAVRRNRFGNRFKADGTKREKQKGEEEQEKKDRDEVEKMLKADTMKEARTEFYKNGMDKNPWHPNISGTMFWM